MLHCCVGFYPNGEFVVNTVPDGDLEKNIEYNEIMRPGRFYFVDGEYVCGGLLYQEAKEKFIEECKQKIKDLGLKARTFSSKPYL